MELKANLMTGEDVQRALRRIAHQIIEKNQGCDNLVLLGIKRRGLPLALRLAQNMKDIEGADVPAEELDITRYRDDLNKSSGEGSENPIRNTLSVDRKIVVLVDDVIYTGRTARAALDAVSALGRAAGIQLAVLVDRGHRELPIRPDYVGKNVPTSKNEIVSVMVDELDGMTCVNLYSKQ